MTPGGWAEGEVRDLALDVLGEWIKGYTTPDEGPQLRFTPLRFEDNALHVRVEECDPFPGNEREFRISLNVEAV
ncbi:hypothetical protein [Streptomyces sp. bgisy159]|uniref:hypothetical protein n=1 Tax=Streptomyces sp. bgisy159 TaxID=3413795 RepID=UPI003F4A0B61